MEIDPDELDDDLKEEFAPNIEQYHEANNEKRWRLSYLKDQFKCLELDNLFNRYIERISHGYFSQFLSLQIILITAHFIILLANEANPGEVLPDIILYGLISIISLILLIITDKYVKEHPQLLKYLTTIAFMIIFFCNAFIPFYYPKSNLRPAYTTYLIISNYIFLNIHNKLVTVVLGLFVSIFHMVLVILMTYENHNQFYERLASDIIFLTSINGLGVYFQYMNEIVIRRSFLDRRSCVEATHQLKFEEEQENHLMSSIIPQHIIGEVKKDIMRSWAYSSGSDIPKQKPFENPYVENHPNVSILFADIVNYTAMTTRLGHITELLETLDELFGRFDDASEEVLRIKFLGDCYYCVAGLPPNPSPNHAEACVDLGLKMIAIIGDIRQRRNLDINMRIGVHTGKISSGIIGCIKWQYDIWSSDVDIANKMETEGKPGMVHVTQRTRSLLRKSYDICQTDKIINHEKTYLIRPSNTESVLVDNQSCRKDDIVASFKEISEENQRRPAKYIKRNSTVPNDLKNLQNNQRHYSLISNYREHMAENSESDENLTNKRHTFPNDNGRRLSGNPNYKRQSISTDRRLTASNRKRRTAFMNNNIKRYKERLEQTNRELKQTIESMLLTKFEQWFKVNNMYRLLLIFKNFKSELAFIKMPDPLFKYYLLSEILMIVLVYILQNLTLARWDWPGWPFYLCMSFTILFLLPLTWTHHVWTKYVAKFENDHPKNRLIYFLYSTSKFITNSIVSRVLIYTIVYILFCMCVLNDWVDCFHIDWKQSEKHNFLRVIFEDLTRTTDCIVPWHMTETCALAIIMSFLFLRMYMWLKLFYASIIAITYSLCIFKFSAEFYGDSQTFNYQLSPQICHTVSVVFLTITLHLVDRQTEYMHRLDHLWYSSLVEKQKQASDIHNLNTMLLNNILPKHIADLYLNVNRHPSEEVFYENYKDAAVMFASLTNFSVEEMGNGFLKAMNLVISEFDLLLVGNTFGQPIEKIKIAKWTYMAACGLAPGLGNAENIRKDNGNHVVISLLKFAASLMKKLQTVNKEIMQKMKLRIGISHGAIAAGVVGSKKPLYDIWGDPVNMASRMDTTGIPDKIQVLKPTAEIIESFGYQCIYRGEIAVKGRNVPVSTYFVGLDEDFNLQKNAC